MRFLVIVAAVAVLGVASASILNRPGRRLDEKTWRVDSESDDHITYVRRPETPPEQVPTTNNVDCNQTTTEAPPTTAAAPASWRRRSGGSSRSRLDVRSGVESDGRRKSHRQGPSTPVPNTNTYDGYDGDHLWKVSHRTDDHITYTRRISSSTNQGQGQPGDLRRIGTGSDAVLARVVVPGKDDELTEEGLLEGTQVQSSNSGGGHTGYPTNELVHPYVKKSRNGTHRTTSLKSGGHGSHGSHGRRRDGVTRDGSEGHGRRGGRQHSAASSSTSVRAASASPPNVDLTDVDHPPRVGEEWNGWVVVSKSKDHISWDRVGTPRTSPRTSPAARAVANIRESNTQNENRLKALKSSRRGLGARGENKREKHLIPNPQGEMVEGFPRVFNTYSRAFYINDRNIDSAGSIRTSLTDTSNWNVGDELAGWKVVTKDHRGIVWQRIQTPPTQEGVASNGHVLNEEDLLEELNRKGVKEGEESSESDSSSESASNEGENVYHGPPGTWYLAKETKNSITWKRDNTPDDVIFEMNDYPRVGDVQTGWRVTSKSREHISWVRVHSDGTSVESVEQQA